MSDEVWQPIPRTNYSVSTEGRVRNNSTGYVTKGSPDKDGYLRVSIVVWDTRKTIKVHRLVAEAFLCDPPKEKTQVAHINGNPSDNRLDNIRWSTVTENNRDKAIHGTQTRGAAQHKAKLTDDIVRSIRSMAARGVSQGRIAKEFGITKGNVQFVVHGKTWKHVA